jgi:hypothetical protein
MLDVIDRHRPTRPQPAAGNLVLGPMVAVADRVRDAVHSAATGEG